MSTYKVVMTDIARQKIANMAITGEGFNVKYFSIGTGGHDPLNPSVPLQIDVTLTSLPGEYFGPKQLEAATLIDTYRPRFIARLGKPEALGNYSNLGLWAEMTSNPAIKFLFALTNFPLRPKTDQDIFSFVMDLDTE